MAKVVRHLRDGQMEFQKVFSHLCNTKSAWQVWSDFVEMTAIAISNSFEIREQVKQEREARYLSIIGQYSKSEQQIFPELVGILVMSLEREPEQDFLGEMFMALELGSHWKGQFFTPYSVCKAMAKINVASAGEKLNEKEWFGIHDPACGAGATLIAARNHLALSEIGSTQAFFVGQDIDRTAAMMCYIQLSLLGCAGYVVIADTLIHPVTGPLLWPNLTEHQEAWFMPMNFTDPVWVLRLSRTWRGVEEEGANCEEIVTAEEPNCHEIATESQESAETEPQQAVIPDSPAPPEPEIPLVENEVGQLTLF